MPSIKCPYCGRHHSDAAGVKACWRRDTGPKDGPEAQTDPPPVAQTDPPPGPPAMPGAGSLRPVLGRSALIGRDQAVPDGWQGLPEFVVPAAGADHTLLDELESRYRARSPVVIRVEAEFPQADETAGVPVWALDPSFDFPSERLRHAATVNSIDFRAGPRWRWADKALALGALPGGNGDVVLRDGTHALCDGGPMAFFDKTAPETGGLAVVHRVALEAGSPLPPETNLTAADLADDQIGAVIHPQAAARIIAPAGSGKTRVLTERARHLLRAWRIPPSAVCLIAYNKRAADEMKDRTGDLPGLQIKTLNSLGLSIASGAGRFGGGRSIQTIDERGVREIIDRLVSLPRRANTDPAAAWIEGLSAIRLGLRSPAEVEAQFKGDLDGVEEVFDRYRAELARLGVLDYDEQIYAALELLLTDPAARERARAACRVLLVDEFQDLRPAHLLLIRTLAGPDGFVFGVGDDDQTIYGYDGASPDWLIDYERFFPGAGKHGLEVNYRCPPQVVDAARTLLTHNRRRVEKVMRSPFAAGSPVASAVTDDPVGATLDWVSDRLAAGAAPADLAVLTRVNSSLAPVQIALAEHAIPFNRLEGTRLLDRTAVTAALGWLRMALAPNSLRGADIRITLRRPPRRLSPRVAEWAGEKRGVEDLRALSARLDDRLGPKLDEYAADIDLVASAVSTMDTAGVLTVIRDRIGLGSTAAALDRSKTRLRSPHEDDLNVLIQIGRLHPDPKDFEAWLARRLREPSDPAGVTLATVHKVKGQEWDHVVVHDATAGLMPHRLAADHEEERRIFHVAITRCRKSVIVVAGDAPSPFLSEMKTQWHPPAEPEVVPDSFAGRKGTTPQPGIVPGLPPEVRIEGSEEAEDLLRKWRLQRARGEGKPAFVVMHDATLKAIAGSMPQTLEELASVKGIGPAKLEALGDEILAVLDEARESQPPA